MRHIVYARRMRRSVVPVLLSSSLVSLLSLPLARVAHAETLTVKAGTPLDTPCKAIAAAKSGDVVQITAGSYTDACKLPKSLTLEGIGGRPIITAPNPIPNQKGIFAIEGAETDVTIKNLELTGARVPDENGAAIRAQGRALTVVDCVLRENENGVLGGDGGTVTIEHTTFDRNGDGKGYAHNVYIGHAKKLVFRGNYSRSAKIGHLLKSRAEENIVLANRLTGEDGTESYEADFPNGGKTLFAFNWVQQGAATDNPHLLAYGMEGFSNAVNELVVAHNTFVNGRGKGNEIFVNVKGDFNGKASIVNNIFQGGGTVTSFAGATLAGNLEGDGGRVDTAGFDFHLSLGSAAKDKGVDASAYLGGQPLLAYVHPADDTVRTNVGAPDAGAYELGDMGAGSSGGGGSGASGTSGAGMSGAGGSGASGTSGAGTSGAGGTGASGSGGSAPSGTGGNGASGAAGGQGPGGRGGASGSTGNAGFPASAGAGGGVASGSPAGSEEDGCSCRATGQPGTSRSTPLSLSLSALALAAFLRRRR